MQSMPVIGLGGEYVIRVLRSFGSSVLPGWLLRANYRLGFAANRTVFLHP